MKPQLRLLLAALLVAICTLAAGAQDKPRWALKGTADINGKRSNKTYEFVKVESFGPTLEEVRRDAATALPKWLAGKYALNYHDATLTENDPEGNFRKYPGTNPKEEDGDPRVQADYSVVFGGTRPATYDARLVDEYVSYDENADGTFDYTLYQLYAVATAPERKPDYDDFSFTRRYNAGAMVMSLVPGLGQLYKGQNTKAYWIWGAEAVFIAGSIYADHRFRQYRDDWRDPANTEVSESYKSKYKSWRTIRNIAIGGAVATYIVNLIDAAVSKGPRQVVVKKGAPAATEVALAPVLVYDPMTVTAPGIGMRVTF